MKKFIIIITGLLICNQLVFAQHEHHAKDTVPVKKETIKKIPSDKKKMDHTDHSMQRMDDMKALPSHAFSRNLPMSRNGSGTAWNPDSSPMYMWMKQTNKTDWMFHGNIF
ncbi:MAG: hypothetical protein ACXWV2_13780, partial [Chitinophagaceae bacterium]